MAQAVIIQCHSDTEVRLDELVELQGNLKELSEESYKKLRAEILRGFSAPFFVWPHDETGVTTFYLIDGHQRLRVLKQMRTEGVELPETFPAAIVHAESIEEAREKLLAISSQYGRVSRETLYEFASTAGMNFDSIFERFELPGINAQAFADEFLNEASQEQVEDTYTVTVSIATLGEQTELMQRLLGEGLQCKAGRKSRKVTHT